MNDDAPALEVLAQRRSVRDGQGRRVRGRWRGEGADRRFCISGTFHLATWVTLRDDPALEMNVVLLGISGSKPQIAWAPV